MKFKKELFTDLVIITFLLISLLQSFSVNLSKLDKWCYRVCSNNLNYLNLIVFLIFLFCIIYIYIKKVRHTKIYWLFLLPLIFPIFSGKGNENRELGLAYLQSKNFDFELDWNGIIFSEQILYNFVFKNLAFFFESYSSFLYFSRFLVGSFLIYALSRIFSDKSIIAIVSSLYLANIFSISFGGEYIILGASPRTLAYGFSFLTIYHFLNNRNVYIVFSVITALFHIHVYFLLLLPYLIFKSIKNKGGFNFIANFVTSVLLLVFFIFNNSFSSSRSNFIENLIAKNTTGNYVTRVIAEKIIPFHVRPFNFDIENNFLGINEYWTIGFINFVLLIIVYFCFSDSFDQKFDILVKFNLSFLMMSLILSYFDKNAFLSILYLFKPATYFSIFLFISFKFKEKIFISSLVLVLAFSNWFFNYSSNYFESESKNYKYEVINEIASTGSIIVIEASIRNLFSNKFIDDKYEEYFTGNNLMDSREINLRNNLNFSENSFCEELSSSTSYVVVSSRLLNCSKYYKITINTTYGNTGIAGDPFFKYEELNGEYFCSDSCIRIYSNS